MPLPTTLPISQFPAGTPQATDITVYTDAVAVPPATKSYARGSEFDFYFNAVGIRTISPAYVATTTPLFAIYDNGVAGIGATLTNALTPSLLIIDGINMQVGMRVLVWQQANQAENGVYTVTNVGSSTNNWVLTRATDYNNPAQVIQYQIILIEQGNTYAGRSFQQLNAGPFVIGSNAIDFTLFDILFAPIAVGKQWIPVDAPAYNLVPGNSYLANYTGLNVNFKLPVKAAVGTILQIATGTSSGWTLLQNADQNVIVSGISSTTGTSGSWSSNTIGGALSLICCVADTTWTSYAMTTNLPYI